MDAIKRFLKYVGFYTTSCDENGEKAYAEKKASSENQYELSKELIKDLKEIGGQNVHANSFGTVYAYFPGTVKKEPIALIAHMDTAPAAKGKDIKPRIISSYDGGVIEVKPGLNIDPKDFPEFKEKKGHEIIVTDGNTLLGADDKAGIVIGMEAVKELLAEKAAFGPVELVFSTDEEIGYGASHIDVKELKSKYGYTLDGGYIHDIEMENFNAGGMSVDIVGKSIHPGSAKDKMINASDVAVDFVNNLPRFMRPEDTECREGFFYLVNMNGTCENAHMDFIIRDHDANKLMMMEDYAHLVEKRMNEKLGQGTVTVKIKNSYRNMKPEIDKHPEVIKRITDVYAKNGLKYTFSPIRGGTDGAELTYQGFPCPNLGTGGGNFHGPLEYLDVTDMETMIKVVKDLVR